MKRTNAIDKLSAAFPYSVIEADGYFIPHTDYHLDSFHVNKEDTLMVLKHKVLSYLSYYAFLSEDISNYLATCINAFLDTSYTKSDFAHIHKMFAHTMNHDLIDNIIIHKYSREQLEEMWQRYERNKKYLKEF